MWRAEEKNWRQRKIQTMGNKQEGSPQNTTALLRDRQKEAEVSEGEKKRKRGGKKRGGETGPDLVCQAKSQHIFLCHEGGRTHDLEIH